MTDRTSVLLRQVRFWQVAVALGVLAAALLLVAVPKVEATVQSGTVAGVAGADLVAGTNNADYNITFDTTITATATTITVTFPAGYTLDNAEAAITAGTDGAGTASRIDVGGSESAVVATPTTSGQDYIVTLASGTNLSTGAGVAFRITGGVDNPTVSGTTGTFSIDTNATGETQQSNRVVTKLILDEV